MKYDLNNVKKAVIKDLRAEWSKPGLLNRGDFNSQGTFVMCGDNFVCHHRRNGQSQNQK